MYLRIVGRKERIVTPGQFAELLILGCVVVQLPSLHAEFEELFLSPFLAHDVLEVLGKVVNHCFPNPFVGVPSSIPEVAI